MNITKVVVSEAEIDGFEVRVECSVTYDDRHSETIWAELAGPNAATVSEDIDPWVVMLLPAAVALGERIASNDAMDKTLLSNLNSVQRVWHSWHRDSSPIPIESQTTNRFVSAGEPRMGTASFFSGGVDSFHVLSSRTGRNRTGELAGLITVWGFDVPLSKPDAFAKVRESCVQVAKSLSLEANIIATNLRSTRFNTADWGLSHGCALAGIGQLLGRRYGRVLIASSYQIPDFHPWGSHVITDPLCSGSTCEIVHFGADVSRVEKTRLIADFPPAMQYLRVCFSEDAGNCGRCRKCIRTMSTLNLFGALHNFSTFPADSFSPQVLAESTIPGEAEKAFILELAREANAIGAVETANAAYAALAKYKRRGLGRLVRRSLARLPRSFQYRLARLPYLWRFTP